MDQAMDLVRSLIPDETVDDFIDGITNLVGDLSREGITAIKDPEIYPYHWDAYKAVEANGDLTVRVVDANGSPVEGADVAVVAALRAVAVAGLTGIDHAVATGPSDRNATAHVRQAVIK